MKPRITLMILPVEKREYSIDDLINHPSFRRMVKGVASPEEIDRWDNWLREKNENRRKAQQAIPEIVGFAFKDPIQPNIEKEWDNLQQVTIGNTQKKLPPLPTKDSTFTWVYRVAAILVMGTLLGMGFYAFSGSEQASVQIEQITKERTIKTGSDEKKTVQFSDGSEVVLNNNSALTYKVGLLHGQTIKVVLEGEAYFDAENDSEQTKPVFEVHTPDGVIRDIGTEFVITVQKDRSRVVLQEGRVEVSTKKQMNSTGHISVEKGEKLEFNTNGIIKRCSVNSTFYTSWATGSMNFNKTTLRELAAFIEQRFDVGVQVADSDIGDIRIDGGIYFESLGELVRSVSEVTKVPVHQSEDRRTIYIGDGQSH